MGATLTCQHCSLTRLSLSRLETKHIPRGMELDSMRKTKKFLSKNSKD